MKRLALVLSLTLCGIIVSCTKEGDIDPDTLSKLEKCPLKLVKGENNKNFITFEYTLARIKRIVLHDSVEVASTFTYNNKNKIEKMLIEVADNSLPYTVVFEYGDSDKIIKSKTSVGDYPFLTNEFTYEGSNIVGVSSRFEVFGSVVGGKTRVEYTGENVSRVFTRIDGFPELLTFEGSTYDNKPQFMPGGYHTMALGFIGIANNFFAAFGKNNPTLVKIYDDNGKLNETTQTSYEYDKSGIVTQSTQTTTNAANIITTRKIIYQFACL